MKVMAAALLSLLLLPTGMACTGHNSTTATTSSSTTTSTSPLASVPSKTAAATARPTMVPDGWGQHSPTTADIDAMAGWAERHLSSTKSVIDDATSSKISEAVDQRDVQAVQVACEDTTQPLTIRLPAVLPTPDADLTNGLHSLIDAGDNLAAKCSALTDPPTADALDALSSALGDLSAATRFTGNILKRDGSILTAAGR